MGEDNIFEGSRPDQEGDFFGSFLRSSGYLVPQLTPSSRLSKNEVRKIE
jgi:hypothetical protein